MRMEMDVSSRTVITIRRVALGGGVVAMILACSPHKVPEFSDGEYICSNLPPCDPELEECGRVACSGCDGAVYIPVDLVGTDLEFCTQTDWSDCNRDTDLFEVTCRLD